MPRILIADPDSASRKALKLLLAQKLDITTVDEAGDSEALIKSLVNYPPDILLLDWCLYGAPALEICRMLMKAYPGLRVILLSVDADLYRAALDVGAGFIHKGSYPGEALKVIESLLDRQSDG